MPDSTNKHSDAEYEALAEQYAQLKAGILREPLLQLPSAQSVFQSGLGQLQGQQQTFPGQVTLKPQGYETLPGAGAFGPQGVLFAGGSPWKPHPAGAHIANAGLGLGQALQFLMRSGLLQKLLQQHAQGQAAPPPQGGMLPTAPPMDPNAADNPQNY